MRISSEQARQRLARVGSATELRLSPEVLAHFRAAGAGWQTRINDALREWIVEHGEH